MKKFRLSMHTVFLLLIVSKCVKNDFLASPLISMCSISSSDENSVYLTTAYVL